MSIARFISALTVALVVTTTTSITHAEFQHPGGWHTAADIERVRAKLAAGEEPWTTASKALLASGPDVNYQPKPAAVVTRGTGGVDQGGNSALQHQSSDAYTLMIKWVATNDPRYGDAAIRVIDAWSGELTQITGKDARLAAGIYGNKLAQACELAAYYNPHWAYKARAQKMFRQVFVPVVENGASENWGTSCMTGLASMGVFCDEPKWFDIAVHAYRHGFNETDGRAAVNQYIDDTGECAESGRDQPHTQGGIAHLFETAVTAYHQGVNLFPYADDRLLLGMEYTAKYNLGEDVPYHPFHRADGTITYPKVISEKGRARFSPIYEMAANWFAALGMKAPYTQAVRARAGYAPEGTNNDHPGLGTLMFTGVQVGKTLPAER